MRIAVLTGVCLIGLLAGVTGADEGSNLIRNPGFESVSQRPLADMAAFTEKGLDLGGGPTFPYFKEWRINIATVSDRSALRIAEGAPGKAVHSGKRSLLISNCAVYNPCRGVRGRKYKFSVYAKGSKGARLTASIYEYAVVGGKDRSLGTTPVLQSALTTAWRKYEGFLEAQHPDAQHFSFALRSAGRDVCVDDVSLCKVRREYLCPKAKGTPVIDGMINDGVVVDNAWKASVWGVGFVRPGTSRLHADQTQFSLCHDRENLYFGAVCHDRRPGQVKARATALNGKVWHDECLELFLVSASPARKSHLLFNPLGTTALLLDNKPSANAALVVTSAKIKANGWMVEAEIPWQALSIEAPPVDAVWTMNVTREHRHEDDGQGDVDYSTWAYLPEPNFHMPKRFVPLRFVADPGGAPTEMAAVTPGTLKPSNFILDIRKTTGRTDFAPLGPPLESPHIRWARPFAGGAMKALFVMDAFEREAIEVAQRLELARADIVVFYPNTKDKNRYAFSWDGAERIEKNLLGDGEAYDVIVVGADVGNDILADLIVRQVEQGVGLVHLSSGRRPVNESFKCILPELETLEKQKGGCILKNVAIEGLPYSVDKKPTLENSSASANKAVTGMGVRKHGKERVVNIASLYHLRGLAPNLPWYGYLENRQLCNQWWENVYSLLLRSICWAAGYEPRRGIASVKTEGENEVAVLIQAGKADGRLELEVLWDSRKAPSLIKRAAATVDIPEHGRGVTIPIPDEIRTCQGVHFCHVVLRDAETKASLDWATGVVKVRSARRLAGLKPDKPYYRSADTARIDCKIANDSGADEAVVLHTELTDPHGRLVWEGDAKAAAGAGETVCRVGAPLARLLTVAARAHVFLKDPNGAVLDSAWVNLYVPENTRFLADDFVLGILNSGLGGGYLHATEARLFTDTGMKLHGNYVADGYIPGYRNNDSGFKPYLDLMGWAGPDVFHEPRHAKGRKAGDKYARHTRTTCFNDPKLMRQGVEELFARIDYNRRYGLLGYGINDECTISGYGDGPESDFCYCPVCREGFGEYAKRLYGGIEEANDQWGTAFKDWTGIEPMVMEEARAQEDRNYSLWVDYKLYMEDSYLDAFRKVKALVAERYPGYPEVRLAFTNPGFYGQRTLLAGENYYKWSKEETFKLNYSRGVNAIAHRSFNTRNAPVAAWGLHHVAELKGYPWWFAFNGGDIIHHMGAYHGWIAGRRWVGYNIFSPRIAHTERSLALKESSRDLIQGVGKIIRGCERVKGPVALLYSQVSMYTAGAEGKGKAYFDSELNWCNLVRDAGYDLDFVAEETLAETLSRYAILVLPHSLAMSRETQDVIKRFMRKGGTVWADGTPGQFDEHGKHLGGAGVLEALLNGPGTVSKGVHPELKLTRVRCGEGDMTCLNKTPAWMEARTLVPVLLDGKRLRKDADLLRSGQTSGFYETFAFDRGASRYIGISGHVNALGGARPEQRIDIPEGDEAVAIRFDRRAHVYDVRRKQYLGLTDAVDARLRMDTPHFYALMPYKIAGVDLSCRLDKATRTLHFRARLRETGAGDRVLRVELTDPQRQLVDLYAGNFWTRDQELKGRRPLALNDQPGEWRLTVTDVVSGKQDGETFVVER